MVSWPVSAWPLFICFCCTVLKATAVYAGAGDSVPHYYDSFDPALILWAPAQEGNIEEVFKRYEYYAIVYFDDDARLTVSPYQKELLEGVTHWRHQPDGVCAFLCIACHGEVDGVARETSTAALPTA